jgi:hypothetical protein
LYVVKGSLGKNHVKAASSKITLIDIFLQEIKFRCTRLNKPCTPLCYPLRREFQARDAGKNALLQQLLLKSAITTTKTQCVGRRTLRMLFLQKSKEIFRFTAQRVTHDRTKNSGVITPVGVQILA